MYKIYINEMEVFLMSSEAFSKFSKREDDLCYRYAGRSKLLLNNIDQAEKKKWRTHDNVLQ